MYFQQPTQGKKKKGQEQGEMKDWASGHFNLFSFREGKCGGEGHRETKHTAHKQHSWRNHWNIALCFLWAIIGPGAFFPFPLSLSFSVLLFLCTCFAPAWCSLETQTAKANDFEVKGHTCGQKNNAQCNKYRKIETNILGQNSRNHIKTPPPYWFLVGSWLSDPIQW